MGSHRSAAADFAVSAGLQALDKQKDQSEMFIWL